MCNLYSITTNQAAIIALFRVINRSVGNLPPMPGRVSRLPCPGDPQHYAGTEMVTMRWGMPPRRRAVRCSSEIGAENDAQDTAVPAYGRWLTDPCLAHEISP
jgi:hypothetical protein